MTRDDVLRKAIDECMKELYSLATPSIKWEDFLEENRIYSKAYKEWENFRECFIHKDKNPEKWKEISEKYKDLEWENKSFDECIGPRPYEFYYLPKKILTDVCNDYIRAYKLDSQQELLDTITILKNYCKNPIVDKYIEAKGKPGDANWEPGYRGYDHPDNLEKEINNYFKDNYDISLENIAIKELQDLFFGFLDKAGEFYNWNMELNSFSMNVYLGASPNSNKEAVIKNWKKYRMKDIIIDEEKIIKEYYGEDDC